MKVVFSVGPMSSDLIKSMSKSADNVEFYTYNSISEMIKESTLRHVFFDRVIFSEKILVNAEEDLLALDNYIKEYSKNTSVVILCKEENNITNYFNSMFNSPLYTPVILPKVTTKLLLEFVKSDIKDIRVKYYKSEEDEVKTYTSKYTQEPKIEAVENVENEPVKKGFLNKLFGKKEKKVEKTNSQKISPTDINTVANTPDTVSNFSGEVGVGIVNTVVGNTDDSSSLSAEADLVEKGNFTFTESSPGYSGSDDISDEFSPDSLDYDELSLGDFGKNHVDTGYLDELDEEEILSNLNNTNVGDNEGNDIPDNNDDVVVEPVKVNKNISKAVDIFPNSKLTIVTGVRGSDTTSLVLDMARNLTEKGNRVLVADFDCIENNVVSHIDIIDFYNKELYCGLDDRKVYNNEGFSIISNGYGVDITLESNNNLESLLGEYDNIIIDCPLDCISKVSKSILSLSLVVIKVKNNLGSLISSMNSLTSLECEHLMYLKSRFFVEDRDNEFENYLVFLKKFILFSKVDWLSKF